MIILTKAQRKALFRVFQRDFPSWRTPFKRDGSLPCPNCGYSTGVVRVPSKQWRTFRNRVSSSWDRSGCVMIQWHGMWLGIEQDGYTHS
jgi:hypothetical protein